MTDTTAPGTPPVRCTPDGCFDGDCVPCLDCGTTVHATADCYAVDCGVVCVPCGRARYGDDTAHLWGPMWGYPDRLGELADGPADAAATASPADVSVCSVCGVVAELASTQVHSQPHDHVYRRCYECIAAAHNGQRAVACPVCGSARGEWPPAEPAQ